MPSSAPSATHLPPPAAALPSDRLHPQVLRRTLSRPPSKPAPPKSSPLLTYTATAPPNTYPAPAAGASATISSPYAELLDDERAPTGRLSPAPSRFLRRVCIRRAGLMTTTPGATRSTAPLRELLGNGINTAHAQAAAAAQQEGRALRPDDAREWACSMSVISHTARLPHWLATKGDHRARPPI